MLNKYKETCTKIIKDKVKCLERKEKITNKNIDNKCRLYSLKKINLETKQKVKEVEIYYKRLVKKCIKDIKISGKYAYYSEFLKIK